MLDLADVQGYEFFRPLVTGWLAKIEGALTCQSRKNWKEVADECSMFYGKSAAAMWNPAYAKKFWRNIKAPRFRVNINKAFEFVAIYLPNLIWEVPHRQCTPKKPLQIPQDLFPDPQMFEAVMQAIQQESSGDSIRSHLMQSWLNYTPHEMPGNGMSAHNELATLDAMLKGSGHLWPAPYSMPSSDKTLTGCFRRPPEDLIIDPDFNTFQEAKWIALRHIEPHWVVERKYKLTPGSLKNKATLESSWHYAELATRTNEGQMAGERSSGKTNDLVVWYEVWSKLGTGARMTGMPDVLKNHLEETVGDYAYLAICPDCPYPLNCPADKIRNGASSEEIKQHFEWPVPLWTDDRWPVERLIFYEDPDSAYGLPPLAPALGELKAINAIVSWLVNRTWQTSRQMWGVLEQYHDTIKKVLEDGEDLAVFGIPIGGDQDIKKMIQLIEGKEINRDAWDVLQLLSDMFDKRMGMTAFVYGQNEDGTQDRTASTTEARKSAVSARPEHMQKKVVEWQGRVASLEAIVSWLFVKGRDVEPSMGQVGAMLWQQHIENNDFEKVVRQTQFQVAASSIRRPNRERNIANLNEFGSRFLPMVQTYGEASGDYQPANGFMEMFGEQHDMDMSKLFFPAKDPNDPNAQLDQQLKQAEAAKLMAEAKKSEAEAQQNPAQIKMQELQLKSQMDQQKLLMESDQSKAELGIKMQEMQAKAEAEREKAALEIAKTKAELGLKMQEMQIKAAGEQQKMQLDQAKSQQDMHAKAQSDSVKHELETHKAGTDMQLKTAEATLKMILKEHETKTKLALAEQEQKHAKKQGESELKLKEKEIESKSQAEQEKAKLQASAAPKEKPVDPKEIAQAVAKEIAAAIKAIPPPVVNVEVPKSGTKKTQVKRDKDGRISETIQSEE
jgi:hypothetical protein